MFEQLAIQRHADIASLGSWQDKRNIATENYLAVQP